jgi:hypothetical protein
MIRKNILITENQLERIIINLINEQMPSPIMNPKSKQFDKGFEDFVATTKGSGGESSTLEDAISDLGMVFSILGGIVSGPPGWAFLIAGTGLNIAEIKAKQQAGASKYELGLYIAFAVLNLDDIRFLLRGKSFTEEAIVSLFKRIRLGQESVKNTKGYKKLLEAFSEPSNYKLINDLLQKKIAKNILLNLSKMITTKPLIYVVGFLGKLFKISGSVGKFLYSLRIPITQGTGTMGIAYLTFDQLYKLFYGSDQEKMVIRKMSGVNEFVSKLTNTPTDPKIQQIINNRLGPLFIDPKLNEMTLQETQKSIEKYGSLENFQSSLKTSVSSYELAGSNRSIKDIPDNLQKIAENIYSSIDGLGTKETKLYDNLRKIKNKDEFNLINIYLYGKYKENMFDLFNSPYELEFEGKQKILSIINIRIPNFLTINKSTGKISSNV